MTTQECRINFAHLIGGNRLRSKQFHSEILPRIWSCFESQDGIIFDLEEIELIDAFCCVDLLCLIDLCEHEGRKMAIILPRFETCQRYLYITNFTPFAREKCLIIGETLERMNLNKSNTSSRLFSILRLNRASYKVDLLDVQRQLINYAPNVILKNLKNLLEYLPAFTEITYQLADNIARHSRGNGFFMSQRMPFPEIQISICDNGIGIAKSFGQECSDKAIEKKFFEEAIYHHKDEPFQQGIWGCIEIVRKWGGSLRIRSLNFQMISAGHRLDFYDSTFFQGTSFEIKLPISE